MQVKIVCDEKQYQACFNTEYSCFSVLMKLCVTLIYLYGILTDLFISLEFYARTTSELFNSVTRYYSKKCKLI